MRSVSGDDRLRRAVVIIAALTTIGITLELAIERHWGTSPMRIVPWICVAALAWACVTLLRTPSARSLKRVRVVAGAVIVASMVGVALHVNENYTAGPLDQRYETLWASMSEPARWWAALIKSVGPAPTLAPAALAEVAFLLVASTYRHPALTGGIS